MVSTAQIGIHRRHRDLGDQVSRGAGPMHPAKKPRVGIADAVRQQGLDLLLGRCRPLAIDRQFSLKQLLHFRRHFIPDAALAGDLHLIDRGI